VLGVSQTPTSTDTPQSGWTRTRYANAAGVVQVEATSMANVPHNLPVQAAAAIHFFGLDVALPTRTATPTATATSRPPTTPPTTTSSSAGTRTCTAAYTVTNSWTGGFTAAVRVTAGSAAITGWRVTMNLPGGTSIVNLWNGSPSGTTGSVVVSNMPYNGSVNAGGTTEYGFQGSGSGTGVTVSCAAS